MQDVYKRQDYIAWLEKNNKAKLMRFCFRYKPEGWKAYPGYAEFDSHKKLINTPETSVFSKLHLSAYSIEKGCFQCPFASEERNGDITSVSYTHLDVYKRQHVTSPIILNIVD